MSLLGVKVMYSQGCLDSMNVPGGASSLISALPLLDADLSFNLLSSMSWCFGSQKY